MIIIEVILSWLPLIGIEIQIPFFRAIIEPIYQKISKILPTRFSSIDFTPIIVLIIISVIESSIHTLFPSASLFF